MFIFFSLLHFPQQLKWGNSVRIFMSICNINGNVRRNVDCCRMHSEMGIFNSVDLLFWDAVWGSVIQISLVRIFGQKGLFPPKFEVPWCFDFLPFIFLLKWVRMEETCGMLGLPDSIVWNGKISIFFFWSNCNLIWDWI